MGGVRGAVEVRQGSGARAGVPAPGRGPRRPAPGLPGGRSAVTTAGARPAAAAPGTRRDPARPGGRPVPSGPPPCRPVRACPSVAPQAPGRLRLTRRGRRLVVALAAALAVAAAALVQSVLAGLPGSDLRLAGGASVVVQPGDTVWSIAVDLAGEAEDVRAVVDAIQERNGLEGGAPVVPGQVLRVP